MVAQAYTIEPQQADTADSASGIMLEQKSYDASSGTLTMLVSGKLSNASGYSSIGVLLTFDNTKLALLNHSDYSTGAVTMGSDDSLVNLSLSYAVVKPLLVWGSFRTPYSVQDSHAYKHGNRTAFRTFLYTTGSPNSSQLTNGWIPIFEVCFKVTGNPDDLATVLDRESIRFGDVSKDRVVMDGIFPPKNEYSVTAISYSNPVLYRYFGAMSGTTQITSADKNRKIMPATIVYTGAESTTPENPDDTGNPGDNGNPDNNGNSGNTGDSSNSGGSSLPGAPGNTDDPNVSWNNPFSDVSENDWFYSAVKHVFERGLMIGTAADKFGWNTTLTRAMIVTILYRNEGSPDANELVNHFNDVADGLWYTDAVKWASANGIVLGYNVSTFGTNDAVTNEQLAALIFRTQKSSGKIPPDLQIENKYPDWDKISGWAQEAANTLLGQGVYRDIPRTNFSPQAPATRAEIASILYRYLTAIVQ